MHIAIITGASSGLGRQFVQLADQEGLDEIWLVARRQDRLQALADTCRTAIRQLPLDLVDPASLRTITALLAKKQPVVRFLVNAAGFGKIGSYADIEPSDQLQMIDLNCRAAVALTQLALPYMTNASHILEICSAAAFQPIPYLGIYAASKAFLYRYSRALSFELKPRGISVTAVCPYWIRDTEFIRIAQETQNSTYIHSFPLASTEAFVSSRAWQAVKKGRSVVTPGCIATLDRILAKLLPHSFMMCLTNFFRKI